MNENEKNNEEHYLPTTINILIRFDSSAFKTDPDSAITFWITDKNDKMIHDGNDLTSMTDDELYYTGLCLESMFSTLLDDEFERREEFKEKIRKEIEVLTEKVSNET